MRQETRNAKLRRAIADLIAASGCGCCGDRDGKDDAVNRLGKMLRVAKYDDGSGYDFYRYQTRRPDA